jgi:hypothetical protein
MPPDARKLSDFLNRPSTATQDVLSRTELLVQATLALRRHLRDAWTRSVRLARLEGDTAVFFTSNASASTWLRFHGPEVLAFLRERFHPGCTRLEIKVRPDAIGKS